MQKQKQVYNLGEYPSATTVSGIDVAKIRMLSAPDNAFFGSETA
jgi:hypothetical protein